MKHAPALVLIMGLPASGKTVFSQKLALKTGMALLAKDAIKELLFDVLGSRDREWSMQLGVATYRIMDYVMEEQISAGNSIIVEGTFNPKYDNAKFRKLQERFDMRCIQVLCFADGPTLLDRFNKRAEGPERHPGQDTADDIPNFKDILMAGRAPMLDITSAKVEFNTTTFDSSREDAVIARVLELLQGDIASVTP